MINEFVEKILVHQAEGKGASRTQEIEIFFNFVGKVEIPHEEVELTEEEIAAIAEQERRGAKKAEYNRRYMQEKRNNGKNSSTGTERARAYRASSCAGRERSIERMRRLIDNGDAPAKKKPPIGHHGHLRKAYLEGYRPDLYTALVASETLYEHCAEIEAAVRRRLDLIIPQLAEGAGATEELKAADPMQWVGLMNTCKSASGRNRQV